MFLIKNIFLIILLALLLFWCNVVCDGNGNQEIDPDEEQYNDEDDDDSETYNSTDIYVQRNIWGTNLFDMGHVRTCFTPEDVAVLAVRQEYESLLPNMGNQLVDDDAIKVQLDYFYAANSFMENLTPKSALYLSRKALYDTIGGFFNHFLIPVTKFSFYAGFLTFKSVHNVYYFFDEIKDFLNTNGHGWRGAISDFSTFNYRIETLNVAINNNDADEPTPCLNLIMSDENSDNDEQMIVSLPKLDLDDAEDQLTMIWLPFKRKHNFNLQLRSSAFILMRYYVAVTKCYVFHGVAQETFNDKFRDWIIENIVPVIHDETFYPGFGAILRIMETLKMESELSGIAHSDDNEEHYKKAKNLLMEDEVNNVLLKSKIGFFERLLNRIRYDDDKDEEVNTGERAFINYMTTKYIAILILLIVLMFFIVLLVAMIKMWRRKRKSETKQSPPRPPPKLSKKPGLFRKLTGICRKKRNSDQEIEIGENTSSIITDSYRNPTVELKRSYAITQRSGNSSYDSVLLNLKKFHRPRGINLSIPSIYPPSDQVNKKNPSRVRHETDGTSSEDSHTLFHKSAPLRTVGSIEKMISKKPDKKEPIKTRFKSALCWSDRKRNNDEKIESKSNRPKSSDKSKSSADDSKRSLSLDRKCRYKLPDVELSKSKSSHRRSRSSNSSWITIEY